MKWAMVDDGWRTAWPQVLPSDLLTMREELARGSFASAAAVAAMPDALVRRLLDVMDARADVARDYEEEN